MKRTLSADQSHTIPEKIKSGWETSKEGYVDTLMATYLSPSNEEAGTNMGSRSPNPGVPMLCDRGLGVSVSKTQGLESARQFFKVLLSYVCWGNQPGKGESTA